MSSASGTRSSAPRRRPPARRPRRRRASRPRQRRSARPRSASARRPRSARPRSRRSARRPRPHPVPRQPRSRATRTRARRSRRRRPASPTCPAARRCASRPRRPDSSPRARRSSAQSATRRHPPTSRRSGHAVARRPRRRPKRKRRPCLTRTTWKERADMAEATISAKDVKELRDRTGAGMMDCKSALVEANGDVDKAIEVLRVKGQAQAAKRGGRTASEGVVQSYVHATGKIGVLVEINCETDFVARNDDFQEFARDVALHIAAAAPLYVSEEDVPDEDRRRELRIFEEQASDKPENVRPKIAEGRLRKWLEEIVLLNQEHVNQDKHGGQTIEDLRAATASKTGENIVIRRFSRYQVGEEE